MSTEFDEKHAILDEHRHVMEVVARVDECLWNSAPRDKAWGTELARRVGSVVEQLKLHFSGNAERSMFEELAHTAPHLIGKLRNLGAEHDQILTDFRRVAEMALEVDVTDSEAATRLAALARKAIAKLRRHEAEENEIVLDAVLEDLGGGD